MKVKHILLKDLTAAPADYTVRTVIRMMRRTRVNTIFIVNAANEYVGAVSISDIIEASIPDFIKQLASTAFLPGIGLLRENLKRIADLPIAEVLPRDYPVLSPDDSLAYAADLMNKTDRHTVPVVHDGVLIGRLSKIDLVNFALQE